MGYQRAGWHSGLTYRQTCEQCRTVVQYQDDKLDFRPWFADGFVYCPTCRKPLRHNEAYAINGAPPPPAPHEATAISSGMPTHEEQGLSAFCTNCGKAFNEGDRFCSACGAKRG